MNSRYLIENIDCFDSPAPVIYPDVVAENIEHALKIAGAADKLRPHVKTNKTAEVCTMMIDAGITKFKCATVAEAEMLATVRARDVLLAYQPVGPKIERLIDLIKNYPHTKFSCLTDNAEIALRLENACSRNDIVLDVFIDLNVGMNRTGISLENASSLIEVFKGFGNIRLAGIHAYDGHIHDKDYDKRKAEADAAYETARFVRDRAKVVIGKNPTLVMGGTPTFPIHAQRENCETSPGTFIFWDQGYKDIMEDMPFEFGVLIVSRVISVIDKRHVCIDLGYKSVASESPLPRIYFLNADDAIPVSHSEEHLVLEVPDSTGYDIGKVLYGIPKHICPTIALYERAFVAENNRINACWNIIARNRKINF